MQDKENTVLGRGSKKGYKSSREILKSKQFDTNFSNYYPQKVQTETKEKKEAGKGGVILDSLGKIENRLRDLLSKEMKEIVKNELSKFVKKVDEKIET